MLEVDVPGVSELCGHPEHLSTDNISAKADLGFVARIGPQCVGNLPLRQKCPLTSASSFDELVLPTLSRRLGFAPHRPQCSGNSHWQ
jgi:hypothetical protein